LKRGRAADAEADLRRITGRRTMTPKDVASRKENVAKTTGDDYEQI
jgi:hypothetical protein